MAWAWAGLGLSSATLHVLTVVNVLTATFQDIISIPFLHHSHQHVPANPVAVIDGDYEGRTAEFNSYSSGFLRPFMRGFLHKNYAVRLIYPNIRVLQPSILPWLDLFGPSRS
jgi:hypothetical protein